MKLIFNFGGSKFTYIRFEIPIPTKRIYDRFLAVPMELHALKKLREREEKILRELGIHSSKEVRKRERILKQMRELQAQIEALECEV